MWNLQQKKLIGKFPILISLTMLTRKVISNIRYNFRHEILKHPNCSSSYRHYYCHTINQSNTISLMGKTKNMFGAFKLFRMSNFIYICFNLVLIQVCIFPQTFLLLFDPLNLVYICYRYFNPIILGLGLYY